MAKWMEDFTLMGGGQSACAHCYHKTKPLGVSCVCSKGQVMDMPFDAAVYSPMSPTITGANSKQFGGNHYKTKGIQPWDYITSNNMGFLEGCIIKYVSRYQDKGGVEDLRKAQHFLEKLIEVKSND